MHLQSRDQSQRVSPGYSFGLEARSEVVKSIQSNAVLLSGNKSLQKGQQRSGEARLEEKEAGMERDSSKKSNT